ncbi:VWA domain-containing protein [bacterium]|nr:VWA domain-containing protein [candidate division CSSED10-310 bacterium]
MIFRFMYPEIFLMFFGVIAVISGWIFIKTGKARFSYSRLSEIKPIPGAVSILPIFLPRVLRVSALILLILSAARPQSGEYEEVVRSQGIDIVLALDISGSMRALDFQPRNRLEVAKHVMKNFIEKRKHDRIGLVLFGSESFTLCPMTLDHDLLEEFLEQAHIGMVEENTAVGKALATALNRLRDSQDSEQISDSEGNEDNSSKIVILCTDGVNNVQSKMDPITAAKAAAALRIKVYTIGVGTNGIVEFPSSVFPGLTERRRVELDEKTLMEIADITGGKYFNAQNSAALQKIFDIIDKMEKIDLESTKYTRYRELFIYPAVAAFILLALELVISQIFFRRYP